MQLTPMQSFRPKTFRSKKHHSYKSGAINEEAVLGKLA
jgi:hypothetical protein